ncbi:hypothetical protein BGZ94_009339 [Podila epigama]|nr:hypothetical protein BGZ94_009339 [Podila epigama]
MCIITIGGRRVRGNVYDRVKTTKVEKTKVNKTSRSKRDAEEQQQRMTQELAQETEQKIQQSSGRLGQVINNGLKGLCETVTLSKGYTHHLLGTHMAKNIQPAIEAFVAAGRASDFKANHADSQAELRGHVLSAIQVDILNTLTKLSRLPTDLGRICTYAIQHYISVTMIEYPDIDNCDARREKFHRLIKGESTLAKETADKFEREYSNVTQPVLDMVRALLDGNIHLSVIEQIACYLSDRIRTQAHHFIPTLKTQYAKKTTALGSEGQTINHIEQKLQRFTLPLRPRCTQTNVPTTVQSAGSAKAGSEAETRES